MKNTQIAVISTALIFLANAQVATADQLLVQSNDLMPITPEQVSKYGALKVYQGIWKAIDKSSTSNFTKTQEWKDLFEKPPLELKNDHDVKRAIAILYKKTGDSSGSPYSANIETFTGDQKSNVCQSARQGKIGYLRLSAIPLRAATSEVKFALIAMPDIDGLILDLRGNAGGNLIESLDVATLFCKDTVSLKLKTMSGEFEDITRKGTAVFLKPIILLIDAQTASGGEILANTLKEQRNVKLVGSKTSGAASIRALTKTDFGYIVAVKIAEVVNKDKTTFENVGLKPDLEINESTWWKNSKNEKISNSTIFKDKTVQAAMKELKNEIK